MNLIGTEWSSVGGRELALASAPQVADPLGRADRDLAVRIAGMRDVSLPWWKLELSGAEVSRGGESRPEFVPPEGTLDPLLQTVAGEVVAAVWTSPDDAIRHYILPRMDSWIPVLTWLHERALPEFVPSAARRVRGSLSGEAELRTTAEATARESLALLEAEYAARHAELTEQARAATVDADTVRDPLLYGSGTPLVDAVTRVLADSGLDVVNLDEEFGDTISADLLVSMAGRAMLVEVKGSSGRPKETLVGAAAKHLTTWPAQRPDIPVHGIVLVLNHQASRHPLERTAAPYTRDDFVRSLPLPVLSTMHLFEWWRLGAFDRTRSALFGDEGRTQPHAEHPDVSSAQREHGTADRAPMRRQESSRASRWFRRAK